MSTNLIKTNQNMLTLSTASSGYWDGLGVWHPNTIVYYPPSSIEPQICSDRVHVFPCLHCGKCQCGKLKLDKK